jgi:hypothetical protein
MALAPALVDGFALGAHLTRRRLVLALSLMVLNAADVLATRAVLDRGGVEMNPLMRNLMEGLALPMGLKVLVAGTVGVLLLCCPPRSKVAEPAVAAVVAGYALIVVWNLSLVVQAST